MPCPIFLWGYVFLRESLLLARLSANCSQGPAAWVREVWAIRSLMPATSSKRIISLLWWWQLLCWALPSFLPRCFWSGIFCITGTSLGARSCRNDKLVLRSLGNASHGV